MTPVQVQALQRYISAVVVVMTKHPEGLREFMAARDHLEASFGHALPVKPKPFPVFPDIL